MSDFLYDVEYSCLGNGWVSALDYPELGTVNEISELYDIPINLAAILVARGVTIEEAEHYLNPKLQYYMPNPQKLRDMDKATQRIIKAIKNKEKILVYGDYDVDGACSSALIYKFLQELDIQAEIFIPDRIDHGYGLNQAILQRYYASGCSLVIAVDCGSNDLNILQALQDMALNLDVIIVDHHKIEQFNSLAYALVNPNRDDDNSELNYLCGAGVVFMLLVNLIKELPIGLKRPDIIKYLDLVALATICDLVPLLKLNRAFINSGLKIARKLQNKGILALAKFANITQPLDYYHLGFILGPAINAGGRIGDSMLGVKLLTNEDTNFCEKVAQELLELNSKRRELEKAELENIIFRLEEKLNKNLPFMIIEMGDWHQGIVGLLASRLKDKYLRPAIILTKQDNGLATGSARSISGFDIGSLIHKAKRLNFIERGGGHAMAAGLTLWQDKLAEFSDWANKEIERKIGQISHKAILKIESVIKLPALTVEFCKNIALAGPYGSCNPRPLIMLSSVVIKFVKILDNDCLKVTLEDENNYKKDAIAFRCATGELGQFLIHNLGRRCHIVGYAELNYFRNIITAQMQIVDAVLLS